MAKQQPGSSGGAPQRGVPQRSHCLLSVAFRTGVVVLRQDRAYKLGRGPEGADIVLPHHEVSRQHAEIRWQSPSFMVEDLGSQNGTFVGGKRLLFPHALGDNDEINIGPFTLNYRKFAGDLSAFLERARAQSDATVRSAAVTPSDGLSGRFKALELIELCQFLAFNRKDGLLRIDGKDAEGEVELVQGSIVRARAGLQAGVDAARKLLAQPEGAFVFEPGTSIGQAEPLVDTMSFLMELCRAHDEADDDPTKRLGEDPTKRLFE